MRLSPTSYLGLCLGLGCVFLPSLGWTQAVLKPDDILTKLSPKEIEAQLPNEYPASYYLYAGRLMKAGDYPGALRWFYIGQLRYRVMLQSHPGQDSSLFRSLNATMGKELNQYGALHHKQWLAAMDAALAWDAAHDNPITPKDKYSAIYAGQRMGLINAEKYITSHAEQFRIAAGRAATQSNPYNFIYTQEVRKASFAGDLLFHDLLSAPGGVAMADAVFFAKARRREIVKIEAIVPYDNRQTGVERWTVRHEDGKTAAYQVKFVPDGRGGTTFSVGLDKGKSAE